MQATYYVARVYDNEVLGILKKHNQYSFDDGDDPLLRGSLRRVDLGRLKHAKAAYKLMRSIEPGSRILFVGTKHWPPELGVSAKTVLGYGFTSRRQPPYCFHRYRSEGWRHRLRIEHLRWVDRGHHGVRLDKLGIRKRFPPSRFFRDGGGVVELVLAELPELGPMPGTEEPLTPGRAAKPVRRKRRLPPIGQIIPQIGRVWFVPKGNRKNKSGSPTMKRWSKDSKRIGHRAEQVVFNHLKNTLHGNAKKSLDWPASRRESPGWDIEYKENGCEVKVEVKGASASRLFNFEITGNEWEAARRAGQRFWLYLVANCRTKNPVIERIQGPMRMHTKGSIILRPTSFRAELASP